MAYSYDRILKDDDEQEPTLKLAPGSTGSTMAPVAQARSAGGSAAPSATTGNSSGQHINFDRILSANSDGANRTAQGLANDVQAKGQEAQKNISNLQTGFNENNNAAFGTQYQYGVYNPMNDYAGGSGQQGVAGQGADKAYKSLHDNQTAWNKTLGSVDAAQKAATNLGSEGGVQAALQNKYGAQGHYSTGNSRFDAGLAQAAGGGRFEKLNKQYGGLTDSLYKANDAAKQSYATQSGAYTSWEADQATADANRKLYDEQMAEIERRKGVDAANEFTDQFGAPQRTDGTQKNDGQMAKQEYDMLVKLGWNKNSPRMKELKRRMGWGS